MTYFEHEMEVLFGDSEYLSADTVFSNKTMISKISEDLRAKVQFVSTKIADQYDALRLTIINRNEGPVDTETFRFVDIIGQKNGYNPHIWDDNGNARWYGFKVNERDYCLIAEIVEDYVSMYADQDMRYHGSGMGGMSL